MRKTITADQQHQDAAMAALRARLDLMGAEVRQFIEFLPDLDPDEDGGLESWVAVCNENADRLAKDVAAVRDLLARRCG